MLRLMSASVPSESTDSLMYTSLLCQFVVLKLVGECRALLRNGNLEFHGHDVLASFLENTKRILSRRIHL